MQLPRHIESTVMFFKNSFLTHSTVSQLKHLILVDTQYVVLVQINGYMIK